MNYELSCIVILIHYLNEYYIQGGLGRQGNSYMRH